MDRRRFLAALPTPLVLAALGPFAACGSARPGGDPIDRQALVGRHSPRVRSIEETATLSVGNGHFAFTADATGLQTFPHAYRELPLATQSEWGWHSFPNPEGYTLEDALSVYDAHGRPVTYADRQNTPAGQWLRQSPHRLSLAQIGFDLRRADGAPAGPGDLTEIDQHLDLWTGTLTSRFRLDGAQVAVQTWAHPARDVLAVRVTAPDLGAARRAVRIAFPYGTTTHTGDPADWTRPDAHRTEIARQTPTSVSWRRVLGADDYGVRAAWSAGGRLEQESAHAFRLTGPEGAGAFELVAAFAPEPGGAEPLPSVEAVSIGSAAHWAAFWSTGGAVELTGSADPRAAELERRVVLSQYLTAIQCAGTMPPQETGLTFNSWHGKFHLEMHWWHAAHFPLWGRSALLARSLPWYRKILPMARAKAERQGYAGVRWPKMVGPDGRESPSGIGPFLIWQQPHVIYLSELLYRADPTPEVLAAYADLVFETAAFMASYPVWKEVDERYVLGPPLIPAQELHRPRTTFNPTFELAYWAFGLETAQQWRERLGMARDAQWDRVLAHLSDFPMHDGLYTNAESDLATFSDLDKRRDHPTLLGAYGFVASPRVDRAAMRRTLDRVMETWQWEETWGWDYPLVALTAARLDAPETAVDALLMDTPKNHYHPNGHNYQRPGLTIYLPGNGGLLTAVATMAAGWRGAPDRPTPGFPEDGWRVRWEGLNVLL